MIRRLSAVLIGLALTLPLTVASVSATTNEGVVASGVTVWNNLAGDTVVTGLVTNHTGSRLTNIQVTATWTTPVASEAAAALVTNLAPHSASPFRIVEEDTDVSAAGLPTVTAAGISQGPKPTGGLSFSAGTLTGDTYTVNVHNPSATAATGVSVSALRSGGAANDAAASAAANVAAGATVEFDIVFDAESLGSVVDGVMAVSTNGSHTTWNNFFTDLGSTSVDFIDAIAWMAEDGITDGCGNGNFCPKAGVTRAQMAVFLTRALELAPAADQGFLDIGTQSPTFQAAINSLAFAGITAGCSVTPKNYCPNQIVTRGQMSKFIVVGYEFGIVLDDPGNEDSFTDDNGNFSEPYNDRMKDLAITTGCGATTYCPSSNVLREQMAVFMYRADQIVIVP